MRHVADILRSMPGREGFHSMADYLRSERAAEDYCNELVGGDGRSPRGVDIRRRFRYLDSVSSVSASETRRDA